MKETLSIMLFEYLKENSPEVFFSLQQEGSLVSYLSQKMELIDGLLEELLIQQRPGYMIEELCMNELTADLKPSRYSYIRELLEEEFISEYHRLLRSGILHFEIINIISVCDPLFEAFGFSEENEEDKHLRYTV